MEPCYQLLDVAARTLKMAMDTGGFYKSPAVLAAVRHYESELMKIVSSYSDGSKKNKTLEAPASSSSPVTGIPEQGDTEDDDVGESDNDSDA